MRAELTAEDVSQYRDSGFLVLRDFLDAAELAELRQILEVAMAERIERYPWGGADFSETGDYSNLFLQTVNLWQTNTKVASFISASPLGAMAATLEDLRRVRLWRDQILLKDGYCDATPYHSDISLWSFWSPHAMTFWLALDDVPLEKGALCYLPGTHKDLASGRTPIRSMADIFRLHPDWRGVDPVFCPVEAGAVCIHNALTAHAAMPNMTNARRLAFTVSVMPDGVIFNGQPSVLPTELIASTKPGTPLADDRQNPVLYARESVQCST